MTTQNPRLTEIIKKLQERPLTEAELEGLLRPLTVQPSLLSGYLTESELAHELDRDPRTLERWRRLGTGPPFTMVGKTPRYRREAALEWLLKQERGAVREPKRRRRVAAG
jgi:hypothetical protein